MILYVARRLLAAIPTLLAVLTLVFVLVRIVPGGVALSTNLGDLIPTGEYQIPYDRGQPQILFMAGRTYYVPREYQLAAISKPEQTESIWLLAFWPGMTPFFVDRRIAQDRQGKVSNTVSTLLTDVTRWKRSIADIFQLELVRFSLENSELPNALQALNASASYHGTSRIGATSYPVDVATFTVSGEMESFVRCDGIDTPNLRPSCELWFEHGLNRFQVDFARHSIDDLPKIREATIALRNRLLHPVDDIQRR